jgi:hypothetical protein
MLNETLLKPNKQLKLKGYTIHRHDRSRAERGGVCICDRNIIPSLVISQSPNDSTIEWITIRLPKILPNGENLQISSVYYPPRTEITKETMREIFKNDNTIVAGDLNAHNVLCCSAETDTFGIALETALKELKLSVHHTKTLTYAPYHRLHYASTIDLVITQEFSSPHQQANCPLKSQKRSSSSLVHRRVKTDR